MTEYRPPTNSVGLVTLFSERPWDNCAKHPNDAPLEYPLYVCGPCWQKSCEDYAAKESERRIMEMREAMRPVLEELIGERR